MRRAASRAIPELVEELLEVLGEERLGSVGESGLGGIVDFDHEPVHARAPRGAREARHEIAAPRGVGRVREEREMRQRARDE